MKAYLGLLMLPLGIGLALLLAEALAAIYSSPAMPALKPLSLPAGLDLVQPRPPTPVATLSMNAFAGLAPPPSRKRAAKPGAPRPTPLNLTALVSLGDLRLANINGQLVGEGDKVGGYTVTRISDNAVTLQGPGGGRRLTLD